MLSLIHIWTERYLAFINHLQDFGYKLGQTDKAAYLLVSIIRFCRYLFSARQLLHQWCRS